MFFGLPVFMLCVCVCVFMSTSVFVSVSVCARVLSLSGVTLTLGFEEHSACLASGVVLGCFFGGVCTPSIHPNVDFHLKTCP